MFAIQKLSTSFHVRRLCESDAQVVFDLYRSNPQYFDAMNDVPTLSSTKADMTALPPNKTYDDKYYLGFYEGTKLIAVKDLILGYPDEATAFIGLFMVDRARQGRGVGSLIVKQALEQLKSLGFHACRLGYVESNLQSKGFWNKMGFFPTGVQSRQESYTIILMEKSL